MGTVIKCRLSVESLRQAAAEVEKYRKSLKTKCQLFRKRLIEVGIDTAKSNCGDYTGMIVFEPQDGNQNTSYLVATDGQKIVREWYTSRKNAEQGKGTRSYEVSPLLLAEFGSGWLSSVLFDIAGVGQGTMPDSYGHAFDTNGWFWYDEDGTKHHSYGEEPSHPMYAASMAMLFEVDRIGKEVFRTNEVIKC